MKNKIILASLLIAATGVVAFYFYRTQRMSAAKAMLKDDTAVFFNYAKDELPNLIAKREVAQKEQPVDQKKIDGLQAQIDTFTIVNLIAAQDIAALKEKSPEALTFKDGQIWVEGNKFKDDQGGLITSRILAGENALVFVLYHAILDTTETDKEKTMLMLQALFDKKLNPHARAGLVFWVKDEPTSTRTLDYVQDLTLEEIAQGYSFPQAQAAFKKYMATFTQP